MKEIKNLKELEIGEVYFIPALARVCRIMGRDSAELRSGNVPTVIVKTTLPHKSFKDWSKKKAAQAAIALQGSVSHTIDEDFDDREWEETWAMRRRPKLINNIGQPARLDKHQMVAEVYCIKDTRGNERIRRCCQFEGKSIKGWLIEKPPAMFQDELAVPRDDPDMATRTLANTLAKTLVECKPVKKKYTQLVAEAGKLGIDVSDIKGKGATKAIQERINGLCV